MVCPAWRVQRGNDEPDPQGPRKGGVPSSRFAAKRMSHEFGITGAIGVLSGRDDCPSGRATGPPRRDGALS
jgi:hypothetical protein